MTKLMTAEEAKKISNENPENMLEQILILIEKAAESGQFKVNVSEFGFSDESYRWSGSLTRNQKAVCSRLRNLGYQAGMFVESKKNGTDVYLQISWK